MRYNIYIFILFLITSFILSATKAEAFMKQPNPSATLVLTAVEKKADTRIEKLRAYLEFYNSPMADDAEAFVRYADKYDLDWKLVVSLAGVESWYGQKIPGNSYNAWGYGVYGTNVRYFTSWEDGIATVSKDLREKYMNTWGASDIYGIGSRYAADPMWAYKVTNFMNKLEAFDPESVKKEPTLSIAL